MYGFSLVPGFVKGEGQYCSAVRKEDTAADGQGSVSGSRGMKDKPVPAFEQLRKLFTVDVAFRQKKDTVVAVPAGLMQDVSCLESRLNVIAAGCATGTFKGKDFVPDADLALSLILDRAAFAEVELDRQTALKYLHRDALRLDNEPKGLLLLTYQGLPLGFVKNLGNRCNSLYPQSRRIRMDIE